MLILSPISSEKVVKYWETAKLNSDTYMFPTFHFLLQSSDFIIGHKYCQLFSLKWQVHLLVFEKISAWYPNLNKHSYLPIVQVKKKKKQLSTQTIVILCFFLKNLHTSVCSRAALCTPISSHRILRRYILLCVIMDINEIYCGWSFHNIYIDRIIIWLPENNKM